MFGRMKKHFKTKIQLSSDDFSITNAKKSFVGFRRQGRRYIAQLVAANNSRRFYIWHAYTLHIRSLLYINEISGGTN